MKSFKEFTELHENGRIADLKDGKNIDVQVVGMGVYPKNLLEKDVVKSLETLLNLAKGGNFKSLHISLGSNSPLLTKIKALLDVEHELNTPQVRRKIAGLKK